MKTKHQITNQRDLRRAFWREFPQLNRKRMDNGDYVADTRMAFVDWIDRLQRDGVISEGLADRVTL